jgi:hypothetical protein
MRGIPSGTLPLPERGRSAMSDSTPGEFDRVIRSPSADVATLELVDGRLGGASLDEQQLSEAEVRVARGPEVG